MTFQKYAVFAGVSALGEVVQSKAFEDCDFVKMKFSQFPQMVNLCPEVS